ncbi:MAG TPA: EAL domain-containing protein [Gemmatimonas sp.]|uniref:putative bifunctional diguanylate cyclase/phosphodiesterase n=1 Tax=Gemmatimonas sp. TaxID=1962908 RepID=UPI002EDB6592
MTDRRREDWRRLAQPPAKVLLIDDDADIHALVEAMLRPLNVQFASAHDARGGVAQAIAMRPDLILLDQELPDATGVETLPQLRQHPSLGDVPVVVITASEQRDVLTACYEAGASDYIRKPFFGAELRARVQSLIERRRMLDDLGRAAHIDPLTGLPNRALLQWRLQHAIDRVRLNAEESFSLMFIDFDRFKLINDSLGHAFGDMLLTELAQRLRTNLRVHDSVARDVGGSTVARLGGDEFIVILEGTHDAAAAEAVADRLIEIIELPYHLEQHIVRSSASIGIVHSSEGYTEAADMLRDADIAMYEAKARGKGCHALFTSDMREAVRYRMQLENALREAIGTEQMYLAYQPILSLEDRRLESVEVLLRWRHPELGSISPAQFIPIAEETRLILPLSEIVLREACRQFLRWRSETPDWAPRYISVNLSRVQLTDPQLAKRTMAILDELGMPPECLQLEVTESHIMQQRSLAADLMAEFKSHGVRLAMDDFGTGYSSLSCLQEFPFDTLKVDRALTENISRGRGYSALLHAVMSLAENLGLEVIAEGIERVDQLVLLQALGYTYGQGFLLARPLTADALEDWWRSNAVAGNKLGISPNAQEAA